MSLLGLKLMRASKWRSYRQMSESEKLSDMPVHEGAHVTVAEDSSSCLTEALILQLVSRY